MSASPCGAQVGLCEKHTLPQPAKPASALDFAGHPGLKLQAGFQADGQCRDHTDRRPSTPSPQTAREAAHPAT